ncbi:hypothetical protein [Modestobacter sp. KNN46-3]|uniref:hypothetical protein n=1 Tax=Modestobacter sp. KNN46-3 TaxID=2711218 RepID=UPI0013E050C8|nr:hypothetical protein [Modestobacter sp. KNN46-3]
MQPPGAPAPLSPVTTTHTPQQQPFLSALIVPAPSPGVPLTDPQVREALYLSTKDLTELGTDVFAWRTHYRTACTALAVPVDWLTWWTGTSPSDEIRALRRLHRLLMLLASEPVGQTLTVAEAVSRLTEARMRTQSETALFRPSVR